VDAAGTTLQEPSCALSTLSLTPAHPVAGVAVPVQPPVDVLVDADAALSTLSCPCMSTRGSAHPSFGSNVLATVEPAPWSAMMARCRTHTSGIFMGEIGEVGQLGGVGRFLPTASSCSCSSATSQRCASKIRAKALLSVERNSSVWASSALPWNVWMPDGSGFI